MLFQAYIFIHIEVGIAVEVNWNSFSSNTKKYVGSKQSLFKNQNNILSLSVPISTISKLCIFKQ